MDNKRQASSKVGNTAPQTARSKVIWWVDILVLMGNIYRQMKDKKFKTVLVISKGGLIPGYLLYALLRYGAKTASDTPVLREVRAKHYQGRVRFKSPVIGQLPKDLKAPILMVDDINDTSKTLWEVGKKIVLKTGITRVKVATLCEKKNARYKSDYCGERDISKWVIFPWEKNG